MKPKGMPKTGGRKTGSVNKVTSYVKNKMKTKVDEQFVKDMFKDISEIKNPIERVKVKLKIIEFFVPKPKDSELKEQENPFREILLKRFPNERN